MGRENCKVQPSFFNQFPQYGEIHKQVIADLNTLSPTKPPVLESIAQFGKIVLSFARQLGTVEPFKSDWKNNVIHGEIVRSQYTNRPFPFNDWGELVTRYERDWNGSGLTEPTILPVTQQILTHVGLWNDASVRTLVLDNLEDRCFMLFSGMENIRETFAATVPSGNMANPDQAQDFIINIADNMTEMVIKRPIGHVKHFMPEDQMSEAEWKAFKETEIGKKLGLFSTVNWWLVPTGSRIEPNPRLAKYRQIRKDALADYSADPEYQDFATNPITAVKQALEAFRRNYNPN